MAYWSELPSELLHLISSLSNTSSETRRFRSVCSYWRSSVVPSKSPPRCFSPTVKNFVSSSQPDRFGLRLVKQNTFILSPLSDPDSCWVITTEEHKPGALRLISPFSNKSLVKNVDFSVLDLTNVDTLEVGHQYVLRDINGGDQLEHEKVAFGILGNYEDVSDNFILLSTHKSTGKLLMYQSSFQEWTFLDDLALGYEDRGDFTYDWSMCYVDVVNYKGSFYAVTDSGRTVIIEYGNDSSIAVNLIVNSIVGGDKKCLVKSGDDLLLVDLYTCSIEEGPSIEVIAIDVYKLDKDAKKWTLLKSLGGRTIFLSSNSSFSALNMHGVKENCIYLSFSNLTRNVSKKDGNNVEGSGDHSYNEIGVESNEIGVFEYDKGYVGPLEEKSEDSKLFCWPPPFWLNFLR